ncbi:hypothetical protein F4561_001481 [Lipingzhangella halophila]|uniref:Uncharacterized protein n=1 Tax=Lipingzhangella halophila TaxID=1783352 RepID=A0A7W7W1I2_9ACTN|nr:hypothetical protein [Lipingzhangella halophila]MBB4930661.1 hypothetical protein [Lipingzhangella halophila]
MGIGPDDGLRMPSPRRIRRKHPHLTWKQVRRRYYDADRIREEKLVLYNSAKMPVERYRYHGTKIATPFNVDVIDPAGARFRPTSHDDVAFVGQVSERVNEPTRGTRRARCGDNPHAGFGGRGRENRQPKRFTASRPRPNRSRH